MTTVALPRNNENFRRAHRYDNYFFSAMAE
jgi:hypothetical protein